MYFEWCSSYLYTLEITDWDPWGFWRNQMAISDFKLVYYFVLCYYCLWHILTFKSYLGNTLFKGILPSMVSLSIFFFACQSFRRWSGTGLRRRPTDDRSWWISHFCGRPRKPRPLRSWIAKHVLFIVAVLEANTHASFRMHNGPSVCSHPFKVITHYISIPPFHMMISRWRVLFEFSMQTTSFLYHSCFPDMKILLHTHNSVWERTTDYCSGLLVIRCVFGSSLWQISMICMSELLSIPLHLSHDEST